MSIAPCRVHDETAFVLSHSFCVGSWAFFVEDVFPACLTWLRHVNELSVVIMKLRHDDVAFEFGIADLAFDATAIDGHISKVCEQLLCSVLAAYQGEKLWSIIDERRPASTLDECRMCEK